MDQAISVEDAKVCIIENYYYIDRTPVQEKKEKKRQKKDHEIQVKKDTTTTIACVENSLDIDTSSASDVHSESEENPTSMIEPKKEQQKQPSPPPSALLQSVHDKKEEEEGFCWQSLWFVGLLLLGFFVLRSK